jgi:hypothetical protein
MATGAIASTLRGSLRSHLRVTACVRADQCYLGEHGFALEQLSPITAIPWISISMPGRAKLDTVISALRRHGSAGRGESSRAAERARPRTIG